MLKEKAPISVGDVVYTDACEPLRESPHFYFVKAIKADKATLAPLGSLIRRVDGGLRSYVPDHNDVSRASSKRCVMDNGQVVAISIGSAGSWFHYHAYRWDGVPIVMRELRPMDT